MAIAIAGGENVRAQQEGPVQGEFPGTLTNKDRVIRPALASAHADAPESREPRAEVSTNEVRTDLPAVAGAKMLLDAGRGTPEGTRFRWVRIEGPPVEFGDPSRPTIEIIDPSATSAVPTVPACNSSAPLADHSSLMHSTGP